MLNIKCMSYIAEKFYLMYYFMVREDKYFPKKGRALFLIETALGMFLAFFVFGLIGAFNARNLYVSVPIGAITPFFLSWLIVTRCYVKTGKDLEFIKKSEYYSKNQRRILATLGIFSIVLFFVMMFCGGILMSYLWSLYE